MIVCSSINIKRFILLVSLSVAPISSLTANEPSTDQINEPPIDEGDQEYWAYQTVQRPAVPEFDDDTWSKNGIDRFVLQKLREKKLEPVAAAQKLHLLRRITFDLTGLPPTPEEIQRFEDDSSPGAYLKVVDSLLESDAYGERWAQHWLDLVRFADTDGFEHDKVRPGAWRYRDWVIQAFNQDLPYDQFIKLQIAGDEIAPDSVEALLATGYLLAGPDMPDINLQEERRHIFLNAMTANVGEVFLGLRFGCAECHHHRTNPISQHDFYRLRGFFETIDLFKSHEIRLTDSEPESVRITRNRDQTTQATRLWIRGDFRRPGPHLTPQVPRVLRSPTAPKLNADDTSHGRRSELAVWLTDRQNPLTARVMVNRIWQHHFGIGLIATPSDFGWLGEAASHGDLLDWLAVEFMENGWSMKQLHKLIVTSATYQLASFPSNSSTADEIETWNRLRQTDPENRWLGRMRRQRLEGEAIRDATLAVSGELNRKAGGPGVRPPLPSAVSTTLLKNHWPVTEDVTEHSRRSIYLFARRNLRLPLLEVFDKPDANLSCSRRSQTTIAPQALHLLNSDFAREKSFAFAKRLDKFSDDTQEKIDQAYLLALGRHPSKAEIAACREFLNDSEKRSDWANLCHAILNLNEFVYLD